MRLVCLFYEFKKSFFKPSFKGHDSNLWARKAKDALQS
jgi:hypothetical protein